MPMLDIEAMRQQALAQERATTLRVALLDEQLTAAREQMFAARGYVAAIGAVAEAMKVEDKAPIQSGHSLDTVVARSDGPAR